MSQPCLTKLLEQRQTFGVTRLADLTRLDPIGLPVFSAIRPQAKHLSVALGKGQTAEQAKLSALMEAVESDCLENPPKALLHGAYNALKDEHALVDPALFCQSAFLCNIHDQPLAWVLAERLHRKNTQALFVPQNVFDIDSSVERSDFSYFHISSNGMGGGETRYFAACHAMFEAIERHALTAWNARLPKLQRQYELDISTIDDPALCHWINRCASKGFQVRVWDIHCIAGVPSFYCTISSEGLGRQDCFSGSGASFTRNHALMRSLTEAIQAKVAITSGSRDDIFPHYYQKGFQAVQGGQAVSQLGTLSFQSIEETQGFSQDEAGFSELTTLLSKAGFDELIFMNRQLDALGIWVVSVLIPGFVFGSQR